MYRESLKSKTIHGVGWSFVDSVAGSGITFFVSLILARILSPSEYGLIGIVTIFITVISTFVDSGFSTALVRLKDANNVDYSTGFYTNLSISLIGFFLLLFLSPYIATFFKQPQLADLINVMSSIIVIRAFAIVPSAILTKRVDFKTQTKASLISSVFSGFFGVFSALIGFGVWALVIQQISRQLLNTVFLWLYNKWFPLFCFSIDSFKGMWSFGWKVMVTNLISSIWNELNQVVIGKCYSPSTLGLFTRANQFSSLCALNLTNIVQRVSFPVLSDIQDDGERLKAGYKRVIRNTMLISFIVMMGMAACAKSMVFCFVGEKWLDCVPMLQIVCFSMMLYPLHAINLNMLQVKGRSDLYLKLEILKKCILIFPLLLGIFVGIYSMLIGGVITGFISYYLNAFFSGRLIDYCLKEQILDILPSFGVAITMAVIVYLVGLLPISLYILFPIQIALGATCVISLSELIHLKEYVEIKKMILPYIRISK